MKLKLFFAGLTVLTALMGAFSIGCKDDATSPPAATVVPITANLFPIVAGNHYEYKGYATQNSGAGGTPIPDPGNVYRTSWTIVSTSSPTPLGGTAIVVVDSTTIPSAGTFVRNLLIRKDSVGDVSFLQTIGPFKRAFGIPNGGTAADTLIWVAVFRASQGVGSTGAQWTAFDSVFTGASSSQVRLQIFGRIETQESITDSSSTPVVRSTYKSRTWRKITLNGTVVQDDATTSRIWLETGVGPVQMRIVEDTENIGHFRVLSSKNF